VFLSGQSLNETRARLVPCLPNVRPQIARPVCTTPPAGRFSPDVGQPAHPDNLVRNPRATGHDDRSCRRAEPRRLTLLSMSLSDKYGVTQ
jgi:hypothetical protein